VPADPLGHRPSDPATLRDYWIVQLFEVFEVFDPQGTIMQTDTALQTLVDEGWNPATRPPSNDRTVQIAWGDGSTSPETLGFYDGKATHPQQPEKYWWTHPSGTLLPEDSVLAWRDVPKEKETGAMDERDRLTLKAMKTYGGSFAEAIATAAIRADAANYARLKAAFPDLWEQYAKAVDFGAVRATH